MSKKYFKNKIPPGSLNRWGLLALLMPDRGRLNDSGFFAKISEEDFMTELSQNEIDELYELIEELDNKNEKDN